MAGDPPAAAEVVDQDRVAPAVAGAVLEAVGADGIEQAAAPVRCQAEDGVEAVVGAGEVARLAAAVGGDDLALGDAADEEAPARRVPGDAFGHEPRIGEAKRHRRVGGARLLGSELVAHGLELGVGPERVEAGAAGRHDPEAPAEQAAQLGQGGIALAEGGVGDRLVVDEEPIARALRRGARGCARGWRAPRPRPADGAEAAAEPDAAADEEGPAARDDAEEAGARLVGGAGNRAGAGEKDREREPASPVEPGCPGDVGSCRRSSPAGPAASGTA